MGTWGPGNFENDTAAEYLINLCSPIVDQVTQTVADGKRMEPDEPESDILLANIEILAVLAENIGRVEKGWVGDLVFPFPFPPPDTIEEWKLQYLNVWDAYIDKLGPHPDYKVKRREIISATFDRLKFAAAVGPKSL